MVHRGAGCYSVRRSVYELKCPSCGRVVKSAFVRLGAVVACAACRHHYQIDQTHVARRVGLATLEPGEADPLLAGAVVPGMMSGATPGAIPGAGRRVDRAGNVIGLSGLSEAMQRETEPTRSEAGDVPAAPPVARLRRPGQEAGEAASARPHHRSARMIYLLAGVLCLVVAFLGVAIWYANA